MFRATVSYTKPDGLSYSNKEGTFTGLFDRESLLEKLKAFGRDHVEIRGEVLPEDPIRFVVDGVRFGDFDLELTYVAAVTQYLKLDLSPRIDFVKTEKSV